jgi:mannose-6-phosphate isomerase-like protein (cupin superfamily)
MKKIRAAGIVAAILLAGAAGMATFSQEAAPDAETGLKPLTLPLTCPLTDSGAGMLPSKDCTLLGGPPQTAGMRSGIVRLPAGDDVGWHTTGEHEEELVILQGTGEAEIEGQPAMLIGDGTIAYIPPGTRHDVKNTGTNVLEYVYVVAPASSAK